MFQLSPAAVDLYKRLDDFMKTYVFPLEEKHLQKPYINHPDWTSWQTEPAIELLKTKAKAAGLWNLFLPALSGLNNLDYASMAELMGHSLIASEIFNCNAPDTGNMEVLHKYGTNDQKSTWLSPLLAGEIRSVFCMTEPAIASSDPTNLQATIAVDGDEIILNGRKWWGTGMGHPNCKLGIFMGLSDANAAKHQRHSMVIVPLDCPGVKIERMLPVFGAYDQPYGHGEISFTNVRLPKSNIIAGLGKGFAIAQGRLGPGRIHHCMRLIGCAERALKLMIERGLQRHAFGKPIIELGGNTDIIANARMQIDMARLLVQKTAYLIDHYGIEKAYSEVAQIKVVVPQMACTIIDQAIQMHGGAGLSNDTPLAAMYGYARILRLADGPDEVHGNTVAKIEIKKYQQL